MTSKGKWLIVGNWKANPESLKTAKKIFTLIKRKAQKARNVDTVICPPAIYLPALKNLSSSKTLELGAQDFFWEASGAFTGYIGYESLLDGGARYAIVGHSERRAMGETGDIIGKKINATLSSGVTPILCIGEEARDTEMKYLETIKEQLVDAFLKVPKARVTKVVIAYEPVWAVGAKARREARSDEIREIIIFIRRIIGDLYKTKSVPPIRIIYGGSVTPENIEELLVESGVEGFLIGRASLDADKFGEILHLADKIKK